MGIIGRITDDGVRIEEVKNIDRGAEFHCSINLKRFLQPEIQDAPGGKSLPASRFGQDRPFPLIREDPDKRGNGPPCLIEVIHAGQDTPGEGVTG